MCFACIDYLMKVDAKAVGILVNAGQLGSLSVLGAGKRNSCPGCIDVQPYGVVAFFDYFV